MYDKCSTSTGYPSVAPTEKPTLDDDVKSLDDTPKFRVLGRDVEFEIARFGKADFNLSPPWLAAN